jgi:hypothetical protein
MHDDDYDSYLEAPLAQMQAIPQEIRQLQGLTIIFVLGVVAVAKQEK